MYLYNTLFRSDLSENNNRHRLVCHGPVDCKSSRTSEMEIPFTIDECLNFQWNGENLFAKCDHCLYFETIL